MLEEKNIKSEDYVSIPSFKGIIIQILAIFFSFCSLLATPFKKDRLLLLAGILGGLLIGYLYYNAKPVYYEVSMIVESSHLKNSTVSEIIKQLNKIVVSQSRKNLASELGIAEEKARQIILIDTRALNDDQLLIDTNRIQPPFKIFTDVKDNNLADTLQHAIVSYLNNNIYLKRVIDNKKKIYLDKLIFIDGEMVKLDSLKNGYNRSLFTSKPSPTFYNNALDPATIYQHSMILMEEKESVLNWLSNEAEAITVIDGFKSSSTQKSISLFNSLLICAGIGFGISFLLGLSFELRRKLEIYASVNNK